MNDYKILYIVNSLTETSIPLNWAVMLYRRGWNVAVLPVEPQHNQMQPAEFEVPVIEMGAYRRGDPRVIRDIRQKLHQHGIRLIHAHSNYSGGMASLAVLGNKRIYVVNTEHNPAWSLKKIGLLLDSISLLRANYNCFNSNYTKDSLYFWEKYLVRNDPQKVIYNGVPTKHILEKTSKKDIYEKWGLSNDKFYIGMVATFKRQKDHITLLRAIKILSQKHPEIRVLLIGDGPLDKKLREEVSLLGITDQVHFMGLLKRQDVYQVLHILDVSIMTSLFEGFCNAIVEAMAAGLPVLVSDIPTLKEVVGDAGLYFSTGDPVDLAGKLEQLIINEDTRTEYGELARERCLMLYDVEKAIDKYEEVYKFFITKTCRQKK